MNRVTLYYDLSGILSEKIFTTAPCVMWRLSKNELFKQSLCKLLIYFKTTLRTSYTYNLYTDKMPYIISSSYALKNLFRMQLG